MASQGPQPIAQTLNSNTDALQNLRERMADVVETSSLTAAQKTAMMKELVEADYSISRLINIVANSSQDENFTKLAPNTAPNCIRLVSVPHYLQDVASKNCDSVEVIAC